MLVNTYKSTGEPSPAKKYENCVSSTLHTVVDNASTGDQAEEPSEPPKFIFGETKANLWPY